MTDKLQIFRLKDAIRVLKWHLVYEEHPTKYSLSKTTEKRQQDIEFIKNRISLKQIELETLNLKLETQLP